MTRAVWWAVCWLTALPALALAAETLPDGAHTDDGESDAHMQQRFAAPLLDSDELEQLFLESPYALDAPAAEGMRSVQGEELYTESENLQREQIRLQQRAAPELPPRLNLPPLETPREPIRQL